MTSIWGFLLCTGAASAAAGLLLLLKKLLEDKLPPSWQYRIWWLLFARLALPVGLDGAGGRQVLVPLPLWIETAKTYTEQHFASVYDSAWTLTRVTLPFGLVPAAAPQSITDWLFVGYLAGAALCLMWYLGQYARLRSKLRKAQPLSPTQKQQLQQVSAQYGLPVPRVVQVHGLPTAFVCGVLRPVLVLPDTPVDDKVLLHEMMHLKHHDSAQSMLWCLWRAVHWCNPFLQYCFDRIGNDGEATCDQRVLERLQGEQRRDYGRILLSMANEQYPRAAGTSSLSNGGANIARRIKAIARFKRYPQGMRLVASCIAAMLISPLLVGAQAAAPDMSGNGYLNLHRTSLRWQESHHLAQTRTGCCTTMAGALDVYAKALWNGNSTYYLIAADPAAQQIYLAELRQGQQPLADGKPYALRQLAIEDNAADEANYSVWNLTKQPDGSYTGWLVWHWQGTAHTANPNTQYWMEQGWLSEDFLEQEQQELRENALEDGQIDAGEQAEIDALPQVTLGASWLQPVQLRQDGRSWCVAPLGEPQLAVTGDPMMLDMHLMAAEHLAPQTVYTGQGDLGIGRIELYTVATVAPTQTNQNSFFWGSSGGNLTGNADPAAAFCQMSQHGTAVYIESNPLAPAEVQQAGMYLYTHDEALDYPDTTDNSGEMQGNLAGGSSDGREWFSVIYDHYSDGFIPDDGVGKRQYTGRLSQRISPYTELEPEVPMPEPYGFTMQIYRNHEMQDILLLTKEG